MAINKIKVNPLPRFLKGKTHNDMRMVRPIDVNGVIDEVNQEFVLTNASVAQNTADIAAINGEYSYAEVAVSSAQILAMGGAPITLLPASGAGNYYEIPKYIIEYTHVTTAYTLVGDFLYTGLNTSGIYDGIDASLITFGADLPYIGGLTAPWDATDSVNKGVAQRFNDSFVLSTWGGGNPTLGDGTMLVKIWYKVKTFGTEL